MVATIAPPHRLRRVKLKSDSAVVGECRYDALGRRVEKVVTGATYRYIYSGVETVSVYTSTGTWRQDYVYGADIDEVVMLEQADVLDADGDSNTSETARSWYLRNALGSVMEVLEQDKTEGVSYRYDPYGNISITRGGNAQSSDPLGQYVTYTGRWRDEETGLYHYRARSYQASVGRMAQRDPIARCGSLATYEFADSNPTNRVDPTGEYAIAVPVVLEALDLLVKFLLIAKGTSEVCDRGPRLMRRLIDTLADAVGTVCLTVGAAAKEARCKRLLVMCLENTRQPAGSSFGDWKDCGSCYRICLYGEWPHEKCPL